MRNSEVSDRVCFDQEVTCIVSILCGKGHTLTPAAIMVSATALLAWKDRLQGFSIGLTEITLPSTSDSGRSLRRYAPRLRRRATAAIGIVMLCAAITFLIPMLAGRWKYARPEEHLPATDIRGAALTTPHLDQTPSAMLSHLSCGPRVQRPDHCFVGVIKK